MIYIYRAKMVWIIIATLFAGVLLGKFFPMGAVIGVSVLLLFAWMLLDEVEYEHRKVKHQANGRKPVN